MERIRDKVDLFESLRTRQIPYIKFHSNSVSTSHFLPRLVRSINSFLYKFGLAATLNRYEDSITLYSAKQDRCLYTSFDQSALLCNFGSGAFNHPKWRNFDLPGRSKYYRALQGTPHKDFTPIDLSDPHLRLPLDDNSVALIYCSHTLEHLERQHVEHFLAECYRVLQNGGVMRVAVPSTDNDFKILATVANQKHVERQVIEHLSQKVAEHVLSDTSTLSPSEIHSMLVQVDFSVTDFVDRATELGISKQFDSAMPERHISFWDYQQICGVSLAVGFRGCIPFYRGASLAKPFLNLNIFDTTEPHISLYVELIK